MLKAVIAGVATSALAPVLFAAPSTAAVEPQTVGECNSCACSHQDLDGKVSYLTAASDLRSGPSGDCGWISTETNNPTTTYFELYCYVVNWHGQTWSYGHVRGTNRYGWIWDAHLSGDGSTKPCNE